MNIYSGSTDGNGLAAALTNPTTLSRRKGTICQDYPVEYGGKVWPDAEAAFLFYTRPKTDKKANVDAIMAAIIAAKLTQHRRLFEAVQRLGGVAFLEQCRHITYAKSAKFQAWEGYGRESRFIQNLIRGYEMATQEQRK